jgi:integrase
MEADMAILTKHPTKYKGVRYVENTTRKLKNGTFDRLFYIRYRVDGILKEECLGSASEGWNAEKAYKIRSELREAHKTGKGAQTFKGLRATTQAENQVKASEAQAEKVAEMTLVEFFTIHYLPRTKREKRSWKTDEQRFNKLINPALGHLPLVAIQKSHIQDFVDELSDSGAAPSTVKQYMGIIRQAYNVASNLTVENVPVFSGKNPTQGVKLPKVRNARERFLSGKEAAQLIEAASKLKRPDLHDAIVLSLNSGLRLGELRRLTWLDVDFPSRILTVREEAQRKPGGKVPINDAAKAILLNRKKTAEQTDLVFPPIYGSSSRENLSQDFKALVDKLGLNKGLKPEDRQRRVVFHSLRHTFASWMALAGVDIYRIKTLMRHKTLEMTLRYAHLIPDATHDAVYQLAPPSLID